MILSAHFETQPPTRWLGIVWEGKGWVLEFRHEEREACKLEFGRNIVGEFVTYEDAVSAVESKLK